MQPAAAAIAAALIIVLILIAAAYAWYNFTGWQAFSFTTGDKPKWVPAGGADISRLRFKNCTFTVVRGDGVTKPYDVTAVLNGMAVAFEGGISNPGSLALVRPLNPFSFVIPGFNDSKTVADPTAPPWCSSPPLACNSDADCLPGKIPGACNVEQSGTCTPACPAGQTCVNGVCIPKGFCFSCPGGASVTLTGTVRTI